MPRYSLAQPAFPLSYAAWPGSTADSFWQASQWAGSAAGTFPYCSPLYADIKVLLALVQPARSPVLDSVHSLKACWRSRIWPSRAGTPCSNCEPRS